MKNEVVIEIGANKGQDTVKLCKKYPQYQVIACEPVPQLLTEYLWPLEAEMSNLTILPIAVDIRDGVAPFHVSGCKDDGTPFGDSSLYQFQDDIETLWPNRPEFKVSHSRFVTCLRGDTICHSLEVGKILELWIDAQGNDLTVLKSFGRYLNMVVGGRCEAAAKVELYKHTNNKQRDAERFLNDNGFRYEVRSNDIRGNEVNIVFERKKR